LALISFLAIASSEGAFATEGRRPMEFDDLMRAQRLSDPQISPDGKNVGWLALFPNCCASYPIALKLVVLSTSQQLHTFEGTQLAISKWCFLSDSTSVAYTQSVLHGSNFQHFERRAVSDGQLLGKYEYPHEDAANTTARKRAPAWVKGIPE